MNTRIRVADAGRERLHAALDRVLDRKASARAADSAGLEKRTFEIEAPPEVLDRLEDFLSYVQWCAGVGHSCTVGMEIDGDGVDRFNVKSPKLPVVTEATVVTHGTYPDGYEKWRRE